MKTISVALKAHLALAVTTIAVCWRIVRLDGSEYYFTSHDQNLVVSGHTYLSTAGFSRSAVQTGSTGQVDNLEVLGFLSAGGITEQDLKNQLFDHATIYLFAVNWSDLSQGIVRLRRGWLGETVRAPNGAFSAELRGLTQALVQEFGDLWQPLCRNDLGDSHCKIPIAPTAWQAGHAYVAGDYVSPATKSTDALRVAIFQATDDGTSGGSEPTWDTTVGNSTSDNAVTWVSAAPFRRIASVVTPDTAHAFISSGLTAPAGVATNTATINVVDDTPVGIIIHVTDGAGGDAVITGSTTATPSVAAAVILAALQASDLNMTFARVGNVITLTNNSGATGTITKTNDPFATVVIADFMDSPLDGGVLTWLTGNNAGVSVELKTYNSTTAEVKLWLGMRQAIQAGDKFYYYAGCDKRRDTCATVFNNILNNRSEPDMPGTDQMLSYPDAA